MAQGFSLRFACERPQDRSSLFFFFSSSFFFDLVVLLFLFSNHPFIGIDSDTFFILELFKEAWGCGYKNSIEKNGKDCQPVFDTDS